MSKVNGKNVKSQVNIKAGDAEFDATMPKVRVTYDDGSTAVVNKSAVIE